MTPYILDKALLRELERIGADVKGAIYQSGITSESDNFAVSEKQFFRFMESIYHSLPSDDAVLRIINAENIVTVSPPTFAAFCSYDGNQCIERLIRYKKLVCPLVITKSRSSSKVSIAISGAGGKALPPFVAILETAFIVRLLRKGTGREIRPLKVALPHGSCPAPVKEFLACEIGASDKACIDFSPSDMETPFVSSNDKMLEAMVPGLEKQLAEMNPEESFCNKVKLTILRLLPGGDCTISATASRLNMTVRTLQRRLAADNKTYYELLADIRHRQAIEYLHNFELSFYEISYLLGYKETNSFLRAFKSRQGVTATVYRRDAVSPLRS